MEAHPLWKERQPRKRVVTGGEPYDRQFTTACRRDQISPHSPHQVQVLHSHTKADFQWFFSDGSLGAAPLPRQPRHGVRLLPSQFEERGSKEAVAGVSTLCQDLSAAPVLKPSRLVRLLLVAQPACSLNEGRWRDKTKTLSLIAGGNFFSTFFSISALYSFVPVTERAA